MTKRQSKTKQQKTHESKPSGAGKSRQRTGPDAPTEAAAEPVKPRIHAELAPMWEALQQGDPKAVHEARKLSRKAGAELALADASRKDLRAWRDLRRALAPLRDHDITEDHILSALERAGEPKEQRDAFRRKWAARRKTLQANLALPTPPGPAPTTASTRKAARKALAKQAAHLVSLADTVFTSGDSEAWHEWRKELKKYRYTLDTLIPTPIVLKDTLDALGRMQDAEVVLDILHSPDWTHPDTPRLTRRERDARTRAQKKVRALWPELLVMLNEHQDGKGLKRRDAAITPEPTA